MAKIETKLGIERLEVTIDGEPHTLLCRYITNTGSVHSVYLNDTRPNVVIEQDNNALIVGLFSTEKNRLPDLFDYLEATVSRKHSFDYCLQGEMKQYLMQATKQGGTYRFVSDKLMPKDASVISNLRSAFRRQPKLNDTLSLKILNHLVAAEHVEYSPQAPSSTLESDTRQYAVEITPYSLKQTPAFTPAKNLPKGWYWREHGDGTGALQAPDGHLYFFYDRNSVSSGHFQYLEKAESPWESFDGSLTVFRSHAETIINKNYIQKSAFLDDSIQSAKTRASHHAIMADSTTQDIEIMS